MDFSVGDLFPPNLRGRGRTRALIETTERQRKRMVFIALFVFMRADFPIQKCLARVIK